MSENKRKLRADAVERLKNSVGARVNPDAAIIAIVGGRVGQADWSLECDKLIDLLTDDEKPDTFHDDFYDCESTVDAGEDTQEKLESDIWKVAYEIYRAGGYVDNGSEPNPPTDGIRDLLARQAAITRDWLADVISELAAEKKVLREENDARARALDMQLKNIHKLEHERDELRRQVSELRKLNDSLHARIEEAREALS